MNDPIIIQVSDHRRLVIGPGIKKEGENWVEDQTKTRVGFHKLKKGEWVTAKGVQFDKSLAEVVGNELLNWAGTEG